MECHEIRPKLGSLRQYASVRRIVLDEGAERGLSAIACSNGGGLDFWLLSGRALDIGPLWWRGMQLGWVAPQGFNHPSFAHPQEDSGHGFERHVSGLLATCGFDHVRQPLGDHPLQGRSAHLPARVISAGEYWDRPVPALQVMGEVIQARLNHENLRLTRSIETDIGGNSLRIHDEVCNDGAAPQAHDMLYHFNWGYPAVNAGAWVSLNGKKLAEVSSLPQPHSPAPAQCFDARGDQQAVVTLHSPQSDGSMLRIALSFDLPWLQLWQDLRTNCGIFAIEPCASRRLEGGRSAPLPLLQPGESRHYRLSLRFETTLKETA